MILHKLPALYFIRGAHTKKITEVESGNQQSYLPTLLSEFVQKNIFYFQKCYRLRSYTLCDTKSEKNAMRSKIVDIKSTGYSKLSAFEVSKILLNSGILAYFRTKFRKYNTV